MNYIRNFFGWGAQKNIDNAQPNKVEKEFDGFAIIEKSQLNEPEQNYISKAPNIRNMSNNIVSGIKKITSGVLDIVSCANPFNKVPVNNKTSQQKASMLLDNKNRRKLLAGEKNNRRNRILFFYRKESSSYYRLY